MNDITGAAISIGAKVAFASTGGHLCLGEVAKINRTMLTILEPNLPDGSPTKHWVYPSRTIII